VAESIEQALRYAVPTGNRLAMHPLASGQAMLAALPASELDRSFAAPGRLRLTPSSVLTERALREELAQGRADGYAFSDEVFILGIAGIGRLATIAGEPIGAFSVAIPKARFDEAVKGRAIDLLERTTGLLESA